MGTRVSRLTTEKEHICKQHVSLYEVSKNLCLALYLVLTHLHVHICGRLIVVKLCDFISVVIKIRTL